MEVIAPAMPWSEKSQHTAVEEGGKRERRTFVTVDDATVTHVYSE
jgi:hypothetical protein